MISIYLKHEVEKHIYIFHRSINWNNVYSFSVVVILLLYLNILMVFEILGVKLKNLKKDNKTCGKFY